MFFSYEDGQEIACVACGFVRAGSKVLVAKLPPHSSRGFAAKTFNTMEPKPPATQASQEKILIMFSSPHRRRLKVSNLTSSWETRDTGDSRAVTSILERLSRDFFIPQLFHSEYLIISFLFSSTTVFFCFTCKTTEE